MTSPVETPINEVKSIMERKLCWSATRTNQERRWSNESAPVDLSETL